MAERIVKIRCKGSREAPLSSLEVIQGGLKELSKEAYEKLRERIAKKGFDAPLFVWQNKILDGTQRYRVLGQMILEGWELPGELVPVCDIEADTLEEAKDRLLGYVSQYGKLTDDGLYEFLSGMEEPDLETTDFPDFDMESFGKGFLEDDHEDGEGSGGQGETESFGVVIDCETKRQRERVMSWLESKGYSVREL